MSHGPYVPTKLISPYVVEWLAQGCTMQQLEFLSGINVRTIHEIIYHKRETVRFHTADCLLLAMEKSYAWQWDDELQEIYAAA